jgi:hypothetical protein
MPANDDLDPLLDEWLRRGVQPLAPPSGAFETVRKRARRRKMGKLIATASSAAAVAAAAVFAVPVISSLRLSPAGNSSSVSAGRTHTPEPASTTPRPTASRPAPASTATRTPAARGSVAQNGGTSTSPLPPSFQPASVTFVSSTVGWVLGHSTSGGSTCGSGTCVSVVGSRDGGHTWAKSDAPAVNFYGTGTSTGGVSNLRYLDGTNGWAFGPDLWSTHNGGQSWAQVNTSGQVVVDVEASHGEVFAVFATCHAPAAAPAAITEYGQACTSFTLESTSAKTDNWAPVGTATSSLSHAGATPAQLTSPSIILGGYTGWLLGPDGQVYSGSQTGGAWSQVSATPCPPPVTSSPMTPSQLYYDNSGMLLYGCGIPQSGSGRDYPDFFISADGGRTWHLQANGPTPDAFNSVTYTPTAPIILASQGGLYVRPASTGLWQHIPGTPAGGFSWVGSTETYLGEALPAAQLNYIWMTYDGGLTWQPYKIGS